MKRWLICLGLIVAVCQNSAAEVEWLTDLPTALQKARAENKTVLLDFTGSDWCGWCMKLKKEVFDQPDFASFAQADLIMVEVDFPRHTPISSRQQAANDQLSADYHIEGYPTIVLLNSSGVEVGRSGYVPGGAANYIADLQRKVPSMKPGSAASARNDYRENPTPRPPPVFVPIPPATPNHYSELALKGISGAKGRRFALINNQTLMTGETGSVRIRDGHIEVTCKEIQDNAVVIIADGKEVKLILSDH